MWFGFVHLDVILNMRRKLKTAVHKTEPLWESTDHSLGFEGSWGLSDGCFRENPWVAFCRDDGLKTKPGAGRFCEAASVLSSSSPGPICFSADLCKIKKNTTRNEKHRQSDTSAVPFLQFGTSSLIQIWWRDSLATLNISVWPDLWRTADCGQFTGELYMES